MFYFVIFIYPIHSEKLIYDIWNNCTWTLNINYVKNNYPDIVVVAQSVNCVWLFAIPWTAARQAFLSFTISQSLFKLMSIESVMPSKYLGLSPSLLHLPAIFPSIRVFSNEPALHIRWSKYWSFRFSINPSNEYSGLISVRIDWFNFLAVPGTLKRLLQCQKAKVSILQHSAFFTVLLSHPYMNTGETIWLYGHLWAK